MILNSNCINNLSMKGSNLIQRVLGISKVLNKQREILSKLDSIDRYQKEVYYAEVFRDSVKDCKWLINHAFSPTGAAFNYGSLYFLYRVLDKMRPKRILEFGLGQSSKLIHQYSSFFDDVFAVTYEHDSQWVDFFKKEIDQLYPINIHLAELENVFYNQRLTLSYKNNCVELESEKFDVILVDGPYGSEHYSRSQILHLVPDCLPSSFCIMLHDSEREGEKETISELTGILNKSGIKHVTAVISPTNYQDLFVWCSEDLRYLLTI